MKERLILIRATETNGINYDVANLIISATFRSTRCEESTACLELVMEINGNAVLATKLHYVSLPAPSTAWLHKKTFVCVCSCIQVWSAD